jgi:hypothetical protein
LAQDGRSLAASVARCNAIRWGRGASERCATQWCAGEVYAGNGCRIMGLACEDPETLDVPISHWSQSELERQAVATRHRQKYLARLSWAVFKREADLKPHRNRYWLTPKPDPDFDSKCADICSVYQAALTAAEQDVRTVSID